jgi:transposase-like protein/phosphohistidine swiveling domain-containing protein
MRKKGNFYNSKPFVYIDGKVYVGQVDEFHIDLAERHASILDAWLQQVTYNGRVWEKDGKYDRCDIYDEEQLTKTTKTQIEDALRKYYGAEGDTPLATGKTFSGGVATAGPPVSGIALRPDKFNERELASHMNEPYIAVAKIGKVDYSWLVGTESEKMPNCVGMITEKGGALSHFALVGREQNIPYVVAASANKIRNLDQVTLYTTEGDKPGYPAGTVDVNGGGEAHSGAEIGEPTHSFAWSKGNYILNEDIDSEKKRRYLMDHGLWDDNHGTHGNVHEGGYVHHFNEEMHPGSRADFEQWAKYNTPVSVHTVSTDEPIHESVLPEETMRYIWFAGDQTVHHRQVDPADPFNENAQHSAILSDLQDKYPGDMSLMVAFPPNVIQGVGYSNHRADVYSGDDTTPIPELERQLRALGYKYFDYGGFYGGDVKVSAKQNTLRKCPNCGSHTTFILDGEDKKLKCHNCGNEWKDKELIKNPKKSSVDPDDEFIMQHFGSYYDNGDCDNCGSDSVKEDGQCANCGYVNENEPHMPVPGTEEYGTGWDDWPSTSIEAHFDSNLIIDDSVSWLDQNRNVEQEMERIALRHYHLKDRGPEDPQYKGVEKEDPTICPDCGQQGHRISPNQLRCPLGHIWADQSRREKRTTEAGIKGVIDTARQNGILPGRDTNSREWQCPECGEWNREYIQPHGGTAWHDCENCGWKEGPLPQDLKTRTNTGTGNEDDYGIGGYALPSNKSSRPDAGFEDWVCPECGAEGRDNVYEDPMGGYECRNCGHPINSVDLSTAQLYGPSSRWSSTHTCPRCNSQMVEDDEGIVDWECPDCGYIQTDVNNWEGEGGAVHPDREGGAKEVALGLGAAALLGGGAYVTEKSMSPSFVPGPVQQQVGNPMLAVPPGAKVTKDAQGRTIYTYNGQIYALMQINGQNQWVKSSAATDSMIWKVVIEGLDGTKETLYFHGSSAEKAKAFYQKNYGYNVVSVEPADPNAPMEGQHNVDKSVPQPKPDPQTSLDLGDTSNPKAGGSQIEWLQGAGPEDSDISFGYINGTLYLANTHHAGIMNQLAQDAGEDLFTWTLAAQLLPQMWGWIATDTYDYENAEYRDSPTSAQVRFASDSAIQTPEIEPQVISAIAEALGIDRDSVSSYKASGGGFGSKFQVGEGEYGARAIDKYEKDGSFSQRFVVRKDPDTNLFVVFDYERGEVVPEASYYHDKQEAIAQAIQLNEQEKTAATDPSNTVKSTLKKCPNCGAKDWEKYVSAKGNKKYKCNNCGMKFHSDASKLKSNLPGPGVNEPISPDYGGDKEEYYCTTCDEYGHEADDPDFHDQDSSYPLNIDSTVTPLESFAGGNIHSRFGYIQSPKHPEGRIMVNDDDHYPIMDKFREEDFDGEWVPLWGAKQLWGVISGGPKGVKFYLTTDVGRLDLDVAPDMKAYTSKVMNVPEDNVDVPEYGNQNTSDYGYSTFLNYQDPNKPKFQQDVGTVKSTKVAKVADTHGHPLAPGRTYIMRSVKYKVPDIVMIKDVQPNTISAVIAGDNKGYFPIDITTDDYEKFKYSFEPKLTRYEPTSARFAYHLPTGDIVFSRVGSHSDLVKQLSDKLGKDLFEAQVYGSDDTKTGVISEDGEIDARYGIDITPAEEALIRDTFMDWNKTAAMQKGSPYPEHSYKNAPDHTPKHQKKWPKEVNAIYNACMREGNGSGDTEEEQESSCAAIAWAQYNKGKGHKKKSAPVGEMGSTEGMSCPECGWPDPDVGWYDDVASCDNCGHRGQIADFRADEYDSNPPADARSEDTDTMLQDFGGGMAMASFEDDMRDYGGGDISPGDVIAATPDGTIVLDDGITTFNPERAYQWLKENGRDEEAAILAGRMSRGAHKEARSSLSIGQQQELINEQGVARNIDKLNLDGTHYTTKEEDDELDAHFLW